MDSFVIVQRGKKLAKVRMTHGTDQTLNATKPSKFNARMGARADNPNNSRRSVVQSHVQKLHVSLQLFETQASENTCIMTLGRLPA